MAAVIAHDQMCGMCQIAVLRISVRDLRWLLAWVNHLRSENVSIACMKCSVGIYGKTATAIQRKTHELLHIPRDARAHSNHHMPVRFSHMDCLMSLVLHLLVHL